MAWDTEATRRQLLDAGVRQFSAHGFAGARMESIGRDAGVNKERIYHYFGDKRGFFAAVLARELGKTLSGIEVATLGSSAAGEFAGQLFDRCLANPELPRLTAWESLELGDAVALETRRPICASRSTGCRLPCRSWNEVVVENLLLHLIVVVNGVWALRAVGESVLTQGSEPATRRSWLVAEAEALARGLTSES